MESAINSGLSKQTVKGIHRVLSCFPCVDQAILYGSRVKGTYHNGSDIDLTLTPTKGEVLGLSMVNRIDEALDELMLPYTFDLSEMATIKNPALLEHIQRVGVVLYQK